jgi:hypothetical protein
MSICNSVLNIVNHVCNSLYMSLFLVADDESSIFQLLLRTDQKDTFTELIFSPFLFKKNLVFTQNEQSSRLNLAIHHCKISMN